MSALSNFVWSVADTLRGPYSEAEYGSVVLPFTVLRRLECVMEPHREVMSEVVSTYELEQQRRTHLKIRTRSADNAGLSFWTTSDYTLKKALEDPDNLAENLIYKFAESANDGAGQFYTPRDVVRLLVDLVYAEDTEALRDRGTVRSIYDPTAGTGGSRPDPQLVLLSEIVDRINALFGSEFADPQIEGFVVAAAGMAGEDPRIADQIDHNALDQFMASPELRETLTDAAVLNEGAFGKLTGALTGENERAEEFIRLIGEYLYQSRRMRMTDDADPSTPGSPANES